MRLLFVIVLICVIIIMAVFLDMIYNGCLGTMLLVGSTVPGMMNNEFQQGVKMYLSYHPYIMGGIILLILALAGVLVFILVLAIKSIFNRRPWFY